MKTINMPLKAVGTIAGVAGLAALALLSGCSKAPPPPPKPVAPLSAKAAMTAEPTNDLTKYVSVFEELPPQQGKDPFFPMSHRRDPMSPMEPAAREHVDHTVALKGIVGSVGRRIAVINNETMQLGEEASVRVPGGHVKVKCLEIGETYVVVQVEGEPQTKKLVMEHKK